MLPVKYHHNLVYVFLLRWRLFVQSFLGIIHSLHPCTFLFPPLLSSFYFLYLLRMGHSTLPKMRRHWQGSNCCPVIVWFFQPAAVSCRTLNEKERQKSRWPVRFRSDPRRLWARSLLNAYWAPPGCRSSWLHKRYCIEEDQMWLKFCLTLVDSSYFCCTERVWEVWGMGDILQKLKVTYFPDGLEISV